MSRVGAGANVGDLRAPLFQVRQPESIKLFADPLALMRRIDGIETKLSRLLFAIHGQRDETQNRAILLGNMDLRSGISHEPAKIIRVAPLPAVVLAGENFGAQS